MRKIELIITLFGHEGDTGIPCVTFEACHKAKGYKTIGYHYYITKDGQVHKCRPEEMPGAHARRYNAHSMGVCYEGGLDANGKTADTRTPAQKHAMLNLLRSLKVDYPDAKILGHRDLPWVKKECPCFDAQSEYADLRPLVLEQ